MSSEMRGFAGKADALAKRWRDDAKGFRERDMISAADDADFYAEELEAILPSGEADNGLYGPLTGAQEASMRGYCITQLQAVEDEYPDTGKFIREWLTHVENERNRLFDALLARTEAGADAFMEVAARLAADGISPGNFDPNATMTEHRAQCRRCGDFVAVAVPNTRSQDASGDAEDAKRMDWLVANVTEKLTAKSIQGEFPYPEHKTQYVLPRLIAWADFHGQVGLREAIDIAMQAKEAK